jgi:hypothetical protein
MLSTADSLALFETLSESKQPQFGFTAAIGVP